MNYCEHHQPHAFTPCENCGHFSPFASAVVDAIEEYDDGRSLRETNRSLTEALAKERSGALEAKRNELLKRVRSHLTHDDDCPYDPDSMNPASDFCDCGLRELRAEIEKVIW